METKPKWFEPGLERPDLRQFKVGEMVKTVIHGKTKYCYVMDDGRGRSGRTYTYGLIPTNAVEEYDPNDGEYNVVCYGMYPKDIEPCNQTEYILHHNQYIKDKYCSVSNG